MTFREASGFALMLLVLGLTAGAPAQTLALEGRRQPGSGEIDRFLASAAGELGTTCSLLLVRDGKVAYERSFGGDPPARPVRIASATKWLTAAVVLSVVAGVFLTDSALDKALPRYLKLKALLRRQG